MYPKKKLFSAFIDFKQALCTVWRNGLWYKFYKSDISDKCLTFKKMFNGIKSCHLSYFPNILMTMKVL